jgi:hypothetical protein
MLCIASGRVSYSSLASYFIKWHSGGRQQGSRLRARARMCAYRCPMKVTELQGGYSLIQFARKYHLVMYRNLSYYVVIFNGDCNITFTSKLLPVRIPVFIDHALVSSFHTARIAFRLLLSLSRIVAASCTYAVRVHLRPDLSKCTNFCTYHRN